MAEKSPAFQRYPKDYLHDENVVLMTLEEEGAYNRLMDFCWLEGSIPDDIRKLSSLCKNVGVKKMQAMWKNISPCFDPHPDQPGRLVHLRLEAERAKQLEWSEAQAENGRKGAEKRWGKHGDPNGVAMARGMAKNSSSSASASSSSFSLNTTTEGDLGSMDVENFVSLAIVTANNGMSSAGIDFKPILPSHGSRQFVFDWLNDGIQRDRIIRTVHAVAVAAKKQISSMKYFDGRVREDHEKSRAEIPPDSPAGQVLASRNELPRDTSAPRTDDIAKKLEERDRAAVGEWKRDHPAELEQLRAKAEQQVSENPAFSLLGPRVRQKNVDGLVDRWIREQMKVAS